MKQLFSLVKPDISTADEIASYKQEFIDAGDSMDGCGSLRRHTPAEWLAFNALLENPDTVSENWVPSIQYVYLRHSDKRIVGMIQLRLHFNDFLRDYGGNIGYSVRPSERRKGYASAMLAALLRECPAHGLNEVLVTCLETNEGSRRTILANGGVYDKTVYCPQDDVFLQRYFIKTAQGRPSP